MSDGDWRRKTEDGDGMRLSDIVRQGAKTINVFRACLDAQLTICAQK